MKFYWNSSHSPSFSISAPPSNSPIAPFVAGGLRFDPNYPQFSPLWNSFNSQIWLHASSYPQHHDWLASSPSSNFPSIIKRTNLPEFPQWSSMLNQAFSSFSTENRKKIVLARAVTLELDSPPNPLAILRALSGIDSPSGRNNLTLFCLQPNNSTAFIGATPETLFRRQGNNLYTEAVAGTRKRGSSPDEDLALASNLLNSPKDRHEHRLVADLIHSDLSSICSQITTDPEPFILKGKYWQHLKQTFQAQLLPNISDLDILHLLHPTPAVGGHPRKGTIELIRNIEPFDRGFYAAPIGWSSPHAAEFAVAIRSALIKDNTITLFSGLGVVPDSNPIDEWNELEIKLEQYLTLFFPKERCLCPS